MMDLRAEIVVVERLDRVQLRLGQRREIGCLRGLPGLGDRSCASDYGRDAGLLDDPAQRELVRRRRGRLKRRERLRGTYPGAEVRARECLADVERFAAG